MEWQIIFMFGFLTGWIGKTIGKLIIRKLKEKKDALPKQSEQEEKK